MSEPVCIDRRGFLGLLGAGIVITLGFDSPRAFAQPAFSYPADPNAYLAIRADGRVTVFSGKIEMGQGALTSQAQLVAEELGVPLASIDMVVGDTALCPPDMGTFGSLTTRMFGPVLRAAAAQARAALLNRAARQLGVPVEQLVARDGVVWVRDDSARSVTYARLAGGMRLVEAVDQKAVLRTAAQMQLVGTSAPRLDGLQKVTGAARYAADIRVPGMLYARVLRPPALGARLASVDTKAAAAQPGVVVVEREGLVAVLHADPEVAETALSAVQAQWTRPASGPDSEGIYAHLAAGAGEPKVLLSRGDQAQGHAAATHTVQSEFHKGYVAHAPLEPHAALAQVVDGQVTVWACTQTPFPTRDRVARALGIDPQRVRVITPFVGGGFGGKSADGQALEAARLAQITGRPVQVAWTRSEEFLFDTYDPASVVQARAGVSRDGHIAFWDSTVIAAGERGAVPVYAIDNVRVCTTGGTTYGGSGAPAGPHPVAVGPWRGPGASMNVFAIESQVDQMAVAAGVDALEFRLRNLQDPRMRRVLQAAALGFGWDPKAAPTRRGRGIACSLDAGTCVATMVEVRVDPATGAVAVVRVVCAQDMGLVVNPEGARMQSEGGITMGLGYALSEELRFDGGDVKDRNFDTYRIPRFSQAPRIQVILVPNEGLAPQGGGEPAITTVGGALANAVFDATAVRLLRLPMTPERVRRAIAQAALPA